MAKIRPQARRPPRSNKNPVKSLMERTDLIVEQPMQEFPIQDLDHDEQFDEEKISSAIGHKKSTVTGLAEKSKQFVFFWGHKGPHLYDLADPACVG